ncbi:MAG: C25 family cysteine peptidase, partial [bacterium]
MSAKFGIVVLGIGAWGWGAWSFGGLTVDRWGGESAQVEVADDGDSKTVVVITHPQFPMAEVQVGSNLLMVPVGEEEAVTVQEGFPALPIISRMVLVHSTAGVHLDLKRLKVWEKEAMPLFFNPPADKPEDEPGEPSPQYLNWQGWWPPQPVVVSEPMIMRGYRMVAVSIFPVQVHPPTGRVKFNEEVEFQLVYEGEGVNPVIDPNRPRPSSSFDRIVDHLVVNPPHRDRGMPKRGSYLVVYNNAQNVRNTIEPLLQWRARQGWEVRTIAIQGNPSADQVKQLIQNAYNQWLNPPEMLCIIGDATGSFPVPAWEGVTDFRYAQLEGNDWLPEVHFGRISAEDIQTLQRVIGRLVSYEADPYMEDINWYRAGMVVAGSGTSGISTISISRWIKRETRDRWGVNDVHEWYYNAPYQGQTVPQFFTNEFQRGILFSTYRGWIGVEGTDVNVIMNFRANPRMPFATIITCNT